MLKRIKNFFHWRQNESGRSMVEMLGVLAVIGVLTLGGLAGYNYAMNKYRANEILNEINLRYTVARQQMTLGVPLNMSEFEDSILGKYEVDVYKPDDRDDVVAFKISHVPGEVAKQLFSSGSGLWNTSMVYFNIEEQENVVSFNEYSHPSLIPQAHACNLTAVGEPVFLGEVAVILYFATN